MNRWEQAAWDVLTRLSPRENARRLLIGSCWHGRGFKFWNQCARILQPDLIVNLGDISGVTPLGIEGAVTHLAFSMQLGIPTIYAQGNHDGPETVAAIKAKGALILNGGAPIEVNGIRVWGYPSPFRSTWGGKPYDDKHVLSVAGSTPLPTGEPYMVAVHDSLQVRRPPPEVRLIVCGHAHVPRLTTGYRVVARTGTAGGGGIQRPGKMTPWQVMLVDLSLPEHRADRIFFVETGGKTVKVEATAVE